MQGSPRPIDAEMFPPLPCAAAAAGRAAGARRSADSHVCMHEAGNARRARAAARGSPQQLRGRGCRRRTHRAAVRRDAAAAPQTRIACIQTLHIPHSRPPTSPRPPRCSDDGREGVLRGASPSTSHGDPSIRRGPAPLALLRLLRHRLRRHHRHSSPAVPPPPPHAPAPANTSSSGCPPHNSRKPRPTPAPSHAKPTPSPPRRIWCTSKIVDSSAMVRQATLYGVDKLPQPSVCPSIYPSIYPSINLSIYVSKGPRCTALSTLHT